MKIRNILDTVILTTSAFFVVGPAAAWIIKVPEPGTISIFGLGVGALYLISRQKPRKKSA